MWSKSAFSPNEDEKLYQGRATEYILPMNYVRDRLIRDPEAFNYQREWILYRPVGGIIVLWPSGCTIAVEPRERYRIRNMRSCTQNFLRPTLPWGGASTLNFPSCIGLDPESTAYPKNISGIYDFSNPQNIPILHLDLKKIP